MQVAALYVDFSENAVFDAGLAVLDYPGTWATTKAEASLLRSFLEG